MKFRGGYNIPLAGRPDGEIEIPPEPEALHLPLVSRRLSFTDIRVAEGQRIRQGQVVAVDPAHWSMPLLAGRGGDVHVDAERKAIVLRNLTVEEEEAYQAENGAEHAEKMAGPAEDRRQKLVDLGAWQFFSDAFSGDVPDPMGAPAAVIVSTMALEPFSSRGDVQLTRRLTAFTRGLEHLQSLLEYQPIYLAVPEVRASLAAQVHETVRGHARVEVLRVAPRYPYDNFALLARRAGLKTRDRQAVWCLRTEGVLAVDRAMTLSQPCTVRIVAVGGPGVGRPTHVRTMTGCPISLLLAHCRAGGDVRVLSGGALTGQALTDQAVGLDAECQALTVLPQTEDREFLGFGRPGLDRQSFGRCFLSAIRKPFVEAMTTELRGERRACIACGYCEDVCPAGIWPHLIHKYLYRDGLEEAEAARVDLCVECGLCSYVCSSKLELMDQFIAAKRQIREELHAEEEEPAAADGQEVSA